MPRTRHLIMSKDITLTFLGTGTSTGVPQLRCGCSTCISADPRDRRLRCSALMEIDDKRILIDCGPDFHQQMLRHGRRDRADYISCVLLTHQHYDHVGGLDDLRPYCYHTNKDKFDFPVYCQADVARDLQARMPYSFKKHPYPGVPQFDLRIIEPYRQFEFEGVTILPLRVSHSILDIVGFKIGNLAYITDAKKIPDRTINEIKDVDTLVINALRQREHQSHLSLEEALEYIKRINPRVAYLTHISHDMGLHAEVSSTLSPNVFLAYDDLKIEIKPED